MSAPMFCDVSQWQGNIDFTAYAAWSRQVDGKARVAIKATEGTGFVDPNFASNQAKALEAGIDEIYYYHFSRPDLGTNPVNEANFMSSVVGSVRTNDRLYLDYEVASIYSTAAWAYAWLVQQEMNYGKLPGIYASSAYILQRLQDARLAKYPLWLANWQFTPDERPPCPPPWTAYEFVQYTDKASIPGIPGNVDCNIFLGVEIPPQPQEEPIMIDLSNGVVASHFSGSDNTIWQCKENGFLVGHAILDFYRSFGGDALCGLTYLGLPLDNEVGVSGHPGVVYQRFERGVACYDPNGVVDNPPGAGQVYLLHLDKAPGQDPRVAQLQAEIATLQQPAQLLGQLNGLIAQASTANAQIGAVLTQAAKLSTLQ